MLLGAFTNVQTESWSKDALKIYCTGLSKCEVNVDDETSGATQLSFSADNLLNCICDVSLLHKVVVY